MKKQAITHLGETVFRLTSKPGPGAVQARLWRFACHRFQTARPFTAAEAAGLAECSFDYTKRYCRWLWLEKGYLSLITRGRHGVAYYQVVSGKEHEAAPQWNRRAEKRKSRGQGSGVRGQVGQASPPADLAPGGREETPPGPPLPKGGETAPEIRYDCDCGICNFCNGGPGPAPPEAGGAKTIMRAALEVGCREKLDDALEEFTRVLVDITGSIGRAWEVIREMKAELLALEEQGHDEPDGPSAGHH